MSDDPLDGTLKVPLTEEVASIEKRAVETGRVFVTTETERREAIVREDLATESVQVTRVPVGRVVDRVPDIRTDGDVTILPVLEEHLVVTKQLVLVEEVHVRRRRSLDRVEVPLTLRHQVAHIREEDDPEIDPPSLR